MITRQTRIQLLIFALVTIIGGAIVGGRYAQLDRLVIDRTYAVEAHFSDSGGIFTGAPVTYRGIEVGRVGALTPERDGVKVELAIENSAPDIPDDLEARVATKSAIGEQYVDLLPRRKNGPFLADGAVIAVKDTAIPISSAQLLIDVNDLVRSVDTDSLSTVVDELGQAFEGTGQDLATILDTSADFIAAADDNIDVTRSLIRGSDSVLQTQIDKQGQLGTFSKNLADLSDTLVDADPDLRRLLDKGGSSARTVREVVAENSEDLSRVVVDLRTVTEPLNENLTGLQTIFVQYPYLLQGTFSVLDETRRGSNEWNAGFGLALTDLTPTCTYAKSGGPASGYQQRRPEAVVSDRELPSDMDCKVTNKIARQPSKSSFNRAAVGADGSWADALLAPLVR
ncbi:MCE family protein [Aeromicrobium chenweiae]|uniref:MCE family protein n=1 Tax=Aeromicrobium chenweiae TaxID=2079793 RepID=UPI00131F27A1|nr:MlaD family protein [Aeromicrobium chenweiae]